MLKIVKFFKNHTWIWIVIACLIFIPQSFTYQAKLNMRVLVTGLAIDKNEEGYEVTAQVVMPSPGSESGGTSARLDFISEVGNSVAEGIQKIAYKIGKTAGLSHTNFVMVGESMLEDNLATALDYFARDAKVNPSVMLLVCSGEAKDMIKQTQNLEVSVGVGLQKVFIYKQSSLNGLVMPIDEFINSSFNLAKSATVSGILIAPEGQEKLGQTSDATSSGSSSEGENSGQSGNQENSSAGGSSNGSSDSSSSSGASGGNSNQGSRIKFYNDIYYFKNGKYVNKLNSEKEILGAFWTDKISNNGDFKVTGITGGILQNATVGLQFTKKKTKTNIKFENGRPKLIFDISIKDIQIVEILNQGNLNINIYNKQDKAVINLIKEGIKEEVKECILSTFNKAKADNVDIFDIGELAYQTKTKEWKKYYSEVGENYLNACEVEVNVDIKNIN